VFSKDAAAERREIVVRTLRATPSTALNSLP